MKSFKVDLKELKFTATRSGGPGGQNVNKVNSCALLNWHVQSSESYTQYEKERITLKLSSIINKEGYIYLRSDEFRDYERNKASCVQKLQKYISNALKVEKPRKKTKPRKSSQIKRIDTKKNRGKLKESRKKIY